jgi:hypothetical protein
MRTNSLLITGLAVALISMAPANARKTQPSTAEPTNSVKPVKQAKAQAPVQIYCKASFPCRPLMKGCHLEHNGPGGFNEEVCN